MYDMHTYEHIRMEHFLPTVTSPKSVSQKNLTGNPRILKDLAADIHANIHQWNAVYLHGVSILKSITNKKIDDSYPCGLQVLCTELEKDIDHLDGIANNFKLAVYQIKAVASLHGENEKLFITWSLKKFIEFAEYIYTAYVNEAMVKRKILENVAHSYHDTQKMLYLTSWIHQPMIPHKINSIVEALLNETGHR